MAVASAAAELLCMGLLGPCRGCLCLQGVALEGTQLLPEGTGGLASDPAGHCPEIIDAFAQWYCNKIFFLTTQVKGWWQLRDHSIAEILLLGHSEQNKYFYMQ